MKVKSKRRAIDNFVPSVFFQLPESERTDPSVLKTGMNRIFPVQSLEFWSSADKLEPEHGR